MIDRCHLISIWRVLGTKTQSLTHPKRNHDEMNHREKEKSSLSLHLDVNDKDNAVSSDQTPTGLFIRFYNRFFVRSLASPLPFGQYAFCFHFVDQISPKKMSDQAM